MILATVLAFAAQAATALAPPVQPCRWEEKVGDSTFVHFGPERICAPWQPRRLYVGVWVYQFEGSHFIEGAKTLADADAVAGKDARQAWFSFDDKSRFPPGCKPALGSAYLVEFTGQDAVPKQPQGPFGGFGHMGLWSREVLLDRVLKLTDLGPLDGLQVRPAGPVRRCPAYP